MAPGPKHGEVRQAVEEDLAELAASAVAPRASAGLRAVARRLADVLDSDSPATAKVQASKTLVDVMAQLRGTEPAGEGGGDAVSRGRASAAKRRRGAAA